MCIHCKARQIKCRIKKEKIMATLTVSRDNNNGVVVLKGKMSWIQKRAVAYRNKGFNVLITWEQK